MKSDAEKEADAKFFAQTGKTPEDEAAASAAALGWVVLVSIIVAISAFGWWLTVY